MNNIKLKIAIMLDKKDQAGYIITTNNKLVAFSFSNHSLGTAKLYDDKKIGCDIQDTEKIRNLFKSLILRINKSISPYFATKITKNRKKPDKKNFRWKSISVEIGYSKQSQDTPAIAILTSLADSINLIPFYNGEPKINYKMNGSLALFRQNDELINKKIDFYNINKNEITPALKWAIQIISNLE